MRSRGSVRLLSQARVVGHRRSSRPGPTPVPVTPSWRSGDHPGQSEQPHRAVVRPCGWTPASIAKARRIAVTDRFRPACRRGGRSVSPALADRTVLPLAQGHLGGCCSPWAESAGGGDHPVAGGDRGGAGGAAGDAPPITSPTSLGGHPPAKRSARRAAGSANGFNAPALAQDPGLRATAVVDGANPGCKCPGSPGRRWGGDRSPGGTVAHAPSPGCRSAGRGSGRWGADARARSGCRSRSAPADRGRIASPGFGPGADASGREWPPCAPLSVTSLRGSTGWVRCEIRSIRHL